MMVLSLTLAFYKGKGTWVDRVIRFVTRSRYSHVEMLYSDTPRLVRSGEENRFCMAVSASSRDGGVRERMICFNPDHWDFVSVPWVEREAALDRIVPEFGKPYDYIGLILSQLFNFHRGGRGWFCSELVAYAIGLPLPASWTPGELKDVIDYHARVVAVTKSIEIIL